MHRQSVWEHPLMFHWHKTHDLVGKLLLFGFHQVREAPQFLTYLLQKFCYC